MWPRTWRASWAKPRNATVGSVRASVPLAGHYVPPRWPDKDGAVRYDRTAPSSFLQESVSAMENKFNELLSKLRDPGDEGIPDGIYDDISNTYTNDLEIRDAKISEIGETVKAYESEISSLKSANYDLMMATAASDESADTGNDDGGEDEVSGVDDLFE